MFIYRGISFLFSGHGYFCSEESCNNELEPFPDSFNGDGS